MVWVEKYYIVIQEWNFIVFNFYEATVSSDNEVQNTDKSQVEIEDWK